MALSSRIIVGNYLKIALSTFIAAACAGLFIATTVMTAVNFSLDRELLQKAEGKFGIAARNRLTAWEDLIRQDRSRTDREKLEKANLFFNSRIRFASDMDVWGVQDYWATPIELLCKAAGDCEDFAIAKYFTLKAMGVDDAKLRITYVKAIQYNIHHMVLTYYSTPEAEPLVLDNLVDSISPASKRTDLMPIFGFNGSGLWTAKQRGQGKMAGSSSRIRHWQDLLQKMSENKL
ncbi:MAG: transglutaminase-like cysteine peptidase [Desulfuromonadaceae bacterium]|nr:transglutaminase-like cysteine peptidase [Desulfuromonadaceae bacterium]